jgi:hypothetical protein
MLMTMMSNGGVASAVAPVTAPYRASGLVLCPRLAFARQRPLRILGSDRLQTFIKGSELLLCSHGKGVGLF